MCRPRLDSSLFVEFNLFCRVAGQIVDEKQKEVDYSNVELFWKQPVGAGQLRNELPNQPVRSDHRRVVFIIAPLNVFWRSSK